MPITLFLVRLVALLLLMWAVFRAQWLMNVVAWLLVGGFFVMLAEAVGLVNWALGSLFGRYPGKNNPN